MGYSAKENTPDALKDSRSGFARLLRAVRAISMGLAGYWL